MGVIPNKRPRIGASLCATSMPGDGEAKEAGDDDAPVAAPDDTDAGGAVASPVEGGAEGKNDDGYGVQGAKVEAEAEAVAAAAAHRKIVLVFVGVVANPGDKRALAVPEPVRFEVLFGGVAAEHFRLPIEIFHKRSTVRCIGWRSARFCQSWLDKTG